MPLNDGALRLLSRFKGQSVPAERFTPGFMRQLRESLPKDHRLFLRGDGSEWTEGVHAPLRNFSDPDYMHGELFTTDSLPHARSFAALGALHQAVGDRAGIQFGHTSPSVYGVSPNIPLGRGYIMPMMAHESSVVDDVGQFGELRRLLEEAARENRTGENDALVAPLRFRESRLPELDKIYTGYLDRVRRRYPSRDQQRWLSRTTEGHEFYSPNRAPLRMVHDYYTGKDQYARGGMMRRAA